MDKYNFKPLDNVYFTRNMHIIKCVVVRIDAHEKEDLIVLEDSLTSQRYTLPKSRVRKWNRPNKKAKGYL